MNRLRIAVALCLVLTALTARLLPGARTIDDAYITFRYARNLLNGDGFAYNPGEYVMGTTTPLYTLLMAGFAAFAGRAQADFPGIAALTNALADCLTCLIIWGLGKKFGSEWGGAAAGLIWALAPYSVTFAIGGLETSVYVLLLLSCVFLYLDNHPLGAGLAAAGAFLTRVDALILLGPLAICWLIRSIRKQEPLPLRAILAAGVPVLVLWITSTLLFGSPIPQSIQAKLVAYRLEPGAAFIRLIQHYATPFLDYNLLGNRAGIGLGLIIYPFLSLVGARAAFKIERRSLPFLVYPYLYFAVFAIPNPLLFRWYLTPPLPAWILLIFLGAAQVIQVVKASPWQKAVLALVVFTFPLASTLGDWRIHPDHGLDRPAPDMAYIKLEMLYQQAADIIAPSLAPGVVLAAGDVGVLGYRTGARILDLVGLNSPQVKHYYPLEPAMYVINYAVSPALVMDELPDLVIILEVYGRNSLLADRRFFEKYRLLQKIDTDMYGSDGLLIFKKIP